MYIQDNRVPLRSSADTGLLLFLQVDVATDRAEHRTRVDFRPLSVSLAMHDGDSEPLVALDYMYEPSSRRGNRTEQERN